MDTQKKIDTLVAWATEHGAKLHPSVEVYNDAHTGFSFRVRHDAPGPISAYDNIVSIPTQLTLSYLNACSQTNGEVPLLPKTLVDKLKPHVVGRLLLVKEFLKREESFWWSYIQALPQPDDRDNWALPAFWEADDAELLEGTNVEVGIEKIRSDVARDVKNIAARIGDCGDELLAKGFTTALYHWAYCIFSSRSFRPSLVLSSEQAESLPSGVGMEDFSVLLPLFDIGNHDMTTDVSWDLDETTRRCALKVGKEHRPGEQVFNNYSMKTNAELLLGYGFMIPATENLHNDYTHVRKRASTTDASEEYLISLRPMGHPSSVLGRRRNSFSVPTEMPVLSAFEHVQPDMAWDIFCTLNTAMQNGDQAATAGDPNKEGQGKENDESAVADASPESRDAFLAGNVPTDKTQHLAQTVAIIQHKVLQELERLTETDVEIASGQEEDLTRNQRLALDYRERCRKVLESTLESIDAVEMMDGVEE